MKNLLYLTRLPERVAIYIPTEFKAEIEKVSTIFNTNFGGSTILNGTGTWNGDNGVEVEGISIIYSNIKSVTHEIVDLILTVAIDIKVNCNQEAVSVEFNNELYLV